MASGGDTELGKAVSEFKRAGSDEQKVDSLRKISSQVKHKALAESTAISIIGLVTDALAHGSTVRDAAQATLAYLVRRMHSQKQLSSKAVSAALNGVPNWPDVLNDLRKRGVDSEIRNQLQQALERPPSSGRATPLGPPRAASRAGDRAPMGARPGSAASGLVKSSTAAPAVAVEDNGLEPFYVASASQLDQICRDMLPDFEGKESEGNWPKRDKNITKLRQITKGNAPTEFSAAYVANWKVLFEGIIKCATSLRTTFSHNGCKFIQEAAAAGGHALDTYGARLYEMAVKRCSDTKPLAAQDGDMTILALISNLSWSKHVLTVIADATQDKNVRPREYSFGWLKRALHVYGQRKSVLEQWNGLDVLEKCFRRGMGDANPKVRETAKKNFWDLHAVWPARADAILSSLDERIQKSIIALNPSGAGPSTASAAPKSAAAARVGAVKNRSSIKDLVAAKRREAAMDRPQSALATLQSSEARSDPKRAAPSRSGAPRTAQEATGGLSSAPVRPGRKVISRQVSRPELVNRDADRPKTPFRAGAAQRPQSRAEEKKDGPRRPTASKANVPLRPGASVIKSVTTNSLPASPEKARDMTPQHRRPNSISEDAPLSIRVPRLGETPVIGTPPRAIPASPSRLPRNSSPLHASSLPRDSTPAHVYEDPRSSPSASPPSADHGDSANSTHGLADGVERFRHSTNLAPRFGLNGDTTATFSDGFSPVKMPLMELSSNDINTPQSGLRKDPRSAKLIDSGIVHMKTGKLDPHGYRKLHDAVMQNIDGLSNAQFEELLFGAIQTPVPGQENTNGSNPSISSERILVQRLHLLSALAKSPMIQPHFSPVLRSLIHILRHDARPEGHTYWVAEGMMKEFALIVIKEPNEVCRGVLQQPQDLLDAIVLKCIAMLVQSRAFDKDDGDLVATLAELAGQAIANNKNVDARMSGHHLAQALGPDSIKQFLGEDKAGVAFMLYQNMKASA